MLEFFVVAVLALHGLACTVILIFVLWRTARRRDLSWPEPLQLLAVPEKIELPDTASFGGMSFDGYASEEILPILAEHFPEEYASYRRGELPYGVSTETWATCCAIHEALLEIEELCS
ncbi:hypothetical protein BH18GEM1_BH18GEM1_16700 [soil metagenome]